MQTTTGRWTRHLLPAMLILSAVFLMSCARVKSQAVIIPADRAVTPLPDGNYQVTPAWLHDRYEYERSIKERCLDAR